MKVVLLLLFTILAVTLGAPHHHPDHSEETAIQETGETKETVAASELTVEKHHQAPGVTGSGLTWYINYIIGMKLLILGSLMG